MTAAPTKIALLTAGLTVAMGAVAAPSYAANKAYAFEVKIDAGPLLTNSYTGSFTFDDTTLDLIDFQFTFQGQAFTINDDPFATADVDGNRFLGISYNYKENSIPPDPVLAFSFVPGFLDVSDAFFAYDLDLGNVGQEGTGTIDYQRIGPPSTSVPGPAPLLGAAAFFGFSRRLRRRIAVGRGFPSVIPKVRADSLPEAFRT